jgi:hypothetical protein
MTFRGRARLSGWAAAGVSACLLVVWPVGARADSLTLLAETGENSTYTCSSTTGPTASCATGLSASATGSLANGTFGVTAGGTGPLPNIPNQTNWVALAETGVGYNFAVSGETTGSMVTNVSVTGTTSASPNGVAEAEISIPTTENFNGVAGTSLLLANGTSVIQIVTPISAGTAAFSFNLGAFAQCPPTNLLAGTSCTATADYLDPVTITSVAVYDANGNLVSNAALTSQSGFTPVVVTAPEPSSLLLIAAGLFVTLGFVIRRSAVINRLQV